MVGIPIAILYYRDRYRLGAKQIVVTAPDYLERGAVTEPRLSVLGCNANRRIFISLRRRFGARPGRFASEHRPVQRPPARPSEGW